MHKPGSESVIVEEWLSLPESERSTETQAAYFALEMTRKYAFDHVRGDIYLEIRRVMMRSQSLLADEDVSIFNRRPARPEATAIEVTAKNDGASSVASVGAPKRTA